MTDTDKATAKPAAEKAANVVPAGDHDRVAMLSLNADGTPNQTPGVEFIGDPEQTLAATKEQFVQQAVSAADTIARGNDGAVASTDDSGPSAGPDPQEEALKSAHESAAKAAEAAAEAAVATLAPGSKGA